MTDPNPRRPQPSQLVTVVDREGRSTQVSPAEASEAFRSGQVGVVGDQVAVRRADGSRERVAASDLTRLMREEPGAVLMSDDDVAQAEFEARNPNNTGRAASAAFLRGAVPFVGSRLVSALGVSPEEQRRLERQHWAVSGPVELAGAIAPALVTGGSSGAARGSAAGAAEAASVARGAAGVAEAANALRGAAPAVERGVAELAATEAVPVAEAVTGRATASLPTAVLENPTAVGRSAELGVADTVAAAPRGPIGSSGLRTTEHTLELANPQYARTVESEAQTIADAALVEASPPARASMEAFDAAQVARGRPVQGFEAPSGIPEEMIQSARQFSANEVRRNLPVSGSWVDPAAAEAAQAAARTSALEAGMPVLGREAEVAAQTLVTGDRVGYQRALAWAINPIGEAGGAVRGIGGTAARVGGTALEGSLYGASNYVQQSDLHDAPLSAEGLVMAMGEGALMGIAGEAVVGGLAAMGRRGSEAVVNRLSPSFREAMSEGRLTQYLADQAGARATGAGASDLAKLRSRMVRNAAGDLVAGGEANVAAAGRVLNESGVLRGAPSLNVISDRLSTVVPAEGAGLRRMVQTATDHLGPQPVANLIRERNAVLAEYRASNLASNRALAERVSSEFETLQRGTMTPAEIHDLRMELDGKIHWNAAQKSDLDAVYRRMRNAARQDLEAAVDRAGSEPGTVTPGLGQAFRDANRRYGYLVWAQKSALRAAARHEAMANAPLNALISGGAAGALFGGVSPGALATGFVTGAIHRWVKEHGPAIAASGLSAFAKSQALNRASAAINASAVRSVRSLFTGRTLRTGALYGATRANARRLTDRQYQRTATGLYRLAHDPEASLAAGSALAPVIQSAPAVGTMAQAIQAARLRYLAALVPGAQDPNPVTGLLAMRSASPKDKAAFADAFDIARNPGVFMKAVASGDVSPAQVAHMRALWPATYQTMVNAVQAELESADDVAPSTVRTIRVLLGEPSITDSPAYVSLLQASYGTPGPTGDSGTAVPTAPTSGAQVRAIESSGVAARELTSNQSAEQRIAAGGPGS